MKKANQLSELIAEGFKLLDEYHYPEALKVGRKLKSMRHSSAFEILALAYLRSDKLSKAIAVLEEGVSKAGRVWILWELLGNCYSDARQFGEAERAYQKALLQEGCNLPVVHLNRAIAFNRARKFAKAKSALRYVSSPQLLRRAEACRIRSELELGHFGSAQRLALKLCKTRPATIENYDRESTAEIFLACALALKNTPKVKRTASRLAFKAVESQPNNTEALAVIREIINPRKAVTALFHRLIIEGTWTMPIGKAQKPSGFFRTLEIAAVTEAAAFQYAKPFFPKAIRYSLAVDEAKTFQNATPVLEGVYFLSGYLFYEKKKKA